jgi:glycosyltransferase involved in cell wall biosynthesis
MFQVPPFDLTRALGGSEAVAIEVAKALCVDHDLSVVCGYPGDDPPPPSSPARGITVIPGFPLDDHVRRCGHLRPHLTPGAEAELQDADLVIAVERSLAIGSQGPRVTLLGGVGYPHTLEVVAERAWDRLVVPSPFVAAQVAQFAPSVAGVVVILNGIDTQLFRPPRRRPPASRITLLQASRPVVDKGVRRAVELTTALRRHGLDAVLVCVSQLDSLDAPNVVVDVQRCETPCIDIRPWQPRMRMPALYAQARLTLCLGDAAEGFGLTAAESISCGTPVLALPNGFLGQMLPEGHGLYLVDPFAGAAGWVGQAMEALLCGPPVCLAHGRPAIQERYGGSRMATEYVELVQSLLEERNPSTQVPSSSRQRASGHSIGSCER